MTETTAPVFSPDSEEEQRLRQQTLRAAETLAAGGEVGSLPVVVANLLAMYEQDVRLVPTAEVERVTARIALLRRAAEGRREYADGIGETETNLALVEQRMALLTEAGTLESAAKIMEGDDRPLYGLLPSWRWTDEMERALAAADNMPKG